MDIFNTLAAITRPAITTNNSNMHYTVIIKSKFPNIGAKERIAHFTHQDDAKQQFDRWAVWLGAELDHEQCDMVKWVAEDDTYILTMQRNEIAIPKNSIVDDIDFDSKN